MINWIKNLLFKEELKLIEELQDKLTEKDMTSDLEEYYTTKYPTRDIKYKGRSIPNISNNIELDLRNFFTPYCSDVKKVLKDIDCSGTHDEIAYNCFLWVKKNFKYVSDKTKGANEFWQFPYESLIYKTGDCEDGAILLANLMLQAGVPYWKIRLTAGWVKYGGNKVGHAYLTYYCQDKDKWVVLDWCYYPNTKKISERTDYKYEENYQTVWFSWDLKNCYTKGLRTQAKVILKS